MSRTHILRTHGLRVTAAAGGLVALLGATSPAHALDLCFTGQGNAGFQVNGDAYIAGGSLVVTPDALNKAGSLFSNDTFSTSGNLRAFFTVNIDTTAGHGADGVAFVMQSSWMGPSFLGAAGHGVGYGGIGPSVVVEFDTWFNPGDLGDNHIGLNFDGDTVNHVLMVDPGFILRDNEFHVWIEYTGATKQLDVFVSLDTTKPATPILAHVVDLPARLGSQFHAGFTGSTGGERSLHEIPFFVMTDGSILDADGDGVFDQCDDDIDNDCTPNASDPDPYDPTTPASPCGGTAPVCTVVSSAPGVGTCAPCDADHGYSGTACPSAAAPYCAADGSCGTCDDNADCAGHPGGSFCDPSGACVATCTLDAQCGATAWCDAAGGCQPKLADAVAVPGGCTPANAERYCLSATCDPRDDGCGIRPDYALSLTKAGSGAGTVTSSPAGLFCDDGCAGLTGSFMEGTLVSLTATPAVGYVFTGWSGACTGLGACSLTMASNQAVSASFMVAMGSACGDDGQCGTGFCVDGLCCDSACGGGVADCQACDLAGLEGTCSPLPSGTECRAAAGGCDVAEVCDGGFGECPADVVVAAGTECRAAAGDCDVAEQCDGSAPTCPADVLVAAGTACRAASCDAGVQTLAAACSGSVDCPAPTTLACGGYLCGETACVATCATGADCAAGYHCAAGACLAVEANGSACESDAACASGHCVDGLCCDAACDGQCEACDVAGSEGACVAVVGAPHGERDACADDGSNCGGSCDGSLRTACSYPGAAVSCRGASCADGVATLAASCDGAGACPDVELQSCGDYVCGATMCLGDCAVQSDCAAGNFCQAGICVPQVANGGACSVDEACGSGFCVDGRCCDAACDGQCEACDVAGLEGTCSPVAGNPHGKRPACASDGSLCGGSCDGVITKACSYPATSVTCRDASCADGTAVLAATCNGLGACPAEQEVTCAPFVCGPSACLGDCTVDSQCDAGSFCAAGVCVAELANGAVCGGDNQCASGHCVDGLCCDLACQGQCEACDVAGLEGTCSPVAGAPHGARPACASDGSLCGGACDGTQTEACAYPSVACREASCADGVAILAASCDGQGACPDVAQQDCGDYLCGEEACLGDCTSDAACADGFFCSAGICAPERALGESCSADNACESGHCIDGLCCDRACDGQCEACDAAGAEGTCSPIVGAPRGGRPACEGQGTCAGQCDGEVADACHYPDASVACGDATCGDGASRVAATCDGAGRCEEAEATSCNGFGCDGSACASSCEDDEGCVAGFACVDGGCVPLAGEGVGGGAPLPAQPTDAGCACATGGPRPSGSVGWLLGLGLALSLGARRRRAA